MLEKNRILRSTFDIQDQVSLIVGFSIAPDLNSGPYSGHRTGVWGKKSAIKGDSEALSKITLKPLVEN